MEFNGTYSFFGRQQSAGNEVIQDGGSGWQWKAIVPVRAEGGYRIETNTGWES